MNRPGPSNQEKARFAREQVIRELRRRGAANVAEVQHGNRFEIVAGAAASDRQVRLRVKSKRSGDWQTSTKDGDPGRAEPDERNFWILVDMGAATPGRDLDFFVVPDLWMRHYIHEELQKHLRMHGGRRPVNPHSTHCAIKLGHVWEWRDRWDLLRIF